MRVPGSAGVSPARSCAEIMNSPARCRRSEVSGMPLGLQFHPEGMAENSPTFQGWVRSPKAPSSLQGTAEDQPRAPSQPNAKAAEDCAHSKTLREIRKRTKIRQVLECAQSSAAFLAHPI
jgi:hypothetical protein